MAEVQTSIQSGELSQRFIEFVMMQAQNAALFLGQIPNPQTGQGEVNLDMAKLFIDQLAMIQEKTRGNLTNEEAGVLRNTISNLQMAYVEVAGQEKAAPSAPAPPISTAPESQPAPATSRSAEPSPSGTPAGEGESKKKFTKTYGS
ncbi:MAG TPA: DUF1844 domain-containing protein [Chthoniobacterales bacterium]|nr:DUF1844 domain-containing protein [Chthoniobacterales bacterium]